MKVHPDRAEEKDRELSTRKFQERSFEATKVFGTIYLVGCSKVVICQLLLI